MSGKEGRGVYLGRGIDEGGVRAKVHVEMMEWGRELKSKRREGDRTKKRGRQGPGGIKKKMGSACMLA